MKEEFTLDHILYHADIPEGFARIGRVTWKDEWPRVRIVNAAGKERWLELRKAKKGRPF